MPGPFAVTIQQVTMQGVRMPIGGGAITGGKAAATAYGTGSANFDTQPGTPMLPAAKVRPGTPTTPVRTISTSPAGRAS